MTEQYDPPLRCFVRKMFNAVQPLENRNAGLFFLPVPENFNRYAVTTCFLQTPRKLNFRVAEVVLMYETADEANHHCWPDVVIPANGLALND